jgi:hypothetical protein
MEQGGCLPSKKKPVKMEAVTYALYVQLWSILKCMLVRTKNPKICALRCKIFSLSKRKVSHSCQFRTCLACFEIPGEAPFQHFFLKNLDTNHNHYLQKPIDKNKIERCMS